MEKNVFLGKVKTELDNIRKNATQEEIGKLNFKKFKFDDSTACIYGQMTGHCDSVRAVELHPKEFNTIGRDYSNKCPFPKQDFSEGEDFTALEKYLFMCTKKQHELIFKFLKKEVNNIEIV